jgi:hypothetical protein
MSETRKLATILMDDGASLTGVKSEVGESRGYLRSWPALATSRWPVF